MGATESNTKKGKPRKNGLREVSGDWQGFVEIPLVETAKQQVKDWLNSDEFDLVDLMETAGATGYKVSVGPQNRGGAFVATLTGRTPECVNCGYSLSAFGPDLVSALAAVFFKHFLICEGGAWADKTNAEYENLRLWG